MGFVEIVKRSFKAVRSDMHQLKENVTDWIKFFSAKQTLLEDRVRSLEQKIEILEMQLRAKQELR